LILFGADKEVSDWVADQLHGINSDYFGDCTAIGAVIENKLIGGVVYSNYKTNPDGTPNSIDMSIATVDRRWCSRAYLKAVFMYPFTQLGLGRVQAITSTSNEEANKMLSKLGFNIEGTHPKGGDYGDDCYSWGMLKEECKWI
jgi:RimJ/RimL family protein N-acetyltransferase